MTEAAEVVQGEIVGVTADGDGVARHDGKVVFIPGALLGETVLYKIFRSGANFDRARLIEVLKPVDRKASPCPHDHPGGCGGCSLLHAARPGAARIKRTLVQDALARFGAIERSRVDECRTPGPDLGYRNHARFGVDERGRLTYVSRSEGRALRYRKEIAIDSCAVLHPALEELRRELDGRCAGVESIEMRVGVRTGDRLVIIHGGKKVPAGIDVPRFKGSLALYFRNRVIPQKGMPWIHEIVDGRRFRVTGPAFFQVNTEGASELVSLVREFAAPRPGLRVLDLYAGVGLYSHAAMPADVDILACEIEEFSCNDYRTNAADRPRAKIRNLDVEEFLRDFAPGRDSFDVAIVNPPRNGCDVAALARLGPLAVPKIVMVSCDPGSLARDVKALSGFGYVLKRATPVDQFPGTPHVETVALLERE
jgi:23S rRNA (uracil1939-C5)-methyltransferase